MRKIKNFALVHLSIILFTFKSKCVTLKLAEVSHFTMGFFVSLRMTNSGELKRGPHRIPVRCRATAVITNRPKSIIRVCPLNGAGAQRCENYKNFAFVHLSIILFAFKSNS